MKEADETAPEYSERRWRQQRNEHLKKEAQNINEKGIFQLEVCTKKQCHWSFFLMLFGLLLNFKAIQILGCRKLDNEIAILENGNGMVTHLAFHPFETVIVATDEKNGVVYVLFSLNHQEKKIHFTIVVISYWRLYKGFGIGKRESKSTHLVIIIHFHSESRRCLS